MLADIAKNETSPIGVREAAVEKLTDQALLADIARNDEWDDVRTAAVAKLTGQALLADIASNDGDPIVRRAAERRLKELQEK